MGMFDTIHFKKPLACPSCGAEITSLQTKDFECVLTSYQIGSVLRGGSVHSGIIKETLWCDACNKAGRSPANSPVYLVVWHTVLAGVAQELAQAEARLAAVGEGADLRLFGDQERALDQGGKVGCVDIDDRRDLAASGGGVLAEETTCIPRLAQGAVKVARYLADGAGKAV